MSIGIATLGMFSPLRIGPSSGFVKEIEYKDKLKPNIQILKVISEDITHLSNTITITIKEIKSND